jgi:hypothetical protein
MSRTWDGAREFRIVRGRNRRRDASQLRDRRDRVPTHRLTARPEAIGTLLEARHKLLPRLPISNITQNTLFRIPDPTRQRRQGS